MSSLRILLACPALLALLAGCSTGPSSDLPVDGAPLASEADLLLVASEATAEAWFDAAVAVPFTHITWFTGCFDFRVGVPAGAANLQVAVAGPAFNPAGGTGFMTLRIRPGEDGAWTDPASTQPSERVAVRADQPASGPWQVWVWPNGPVMQQSWQVKATADVPPGTAISLEAVGPDCA